jgi:deoxyribodipyrimidine photo-lyase
MGLNPIEAFLPTPEAAAARVAAIQPAEYARTRNHLDGAVTRLSPYLTHGFVTLRQVLATVLQQHGELPVQHKLVYEFGWREYFRHVWRERGDGILQSLHEGVLPDAAYRCELPDDIRQAATGVAAIDMAVKTLYATGWLHNHARMWLASYVVHLRKVHWRAGADWMVGHLLDGDLASNHLGWQWVAGTASHKPYLFNAQNVAQFAPAAWHSAGSVVDTDYETLDHIARDASVMCEPAPGRAAAGIGVEEPPRLRLPLELTRLPAPASQSLVGRNVRLVHPWSLGDPASEPDGTPCIGIVATDWFAHTPWNALRWAFVLPRLRQLCDVVWVAPAAELAQALRGAACIRGVHDLHLGSAFDTLGLQVPPSLLPGPTLPCASFSQYWQRSTKGLREASELLERVEMRPIGA